MSHSFIPSSRIHSHSEQCVPRTTLLDGNVVVRSGPSLGELNRRDRH